MKIELQNKLFEKYPRLFRQRTLPMQETCMCWGIECGDGWYDLIDNACHLIQSHCTWRINHAQYLKEKDGTDFNESDLQCEFQQVKEKWGSLRIYHNGDEFVDGVIEMALRMSENTCIQCGSNHNVTFTKGWVVPLCEVCHQLDQSKMKNEI